ncbi:MAG: dUTP diphosphatase [bacterium]
MAAAPDSIKVLRLDPELPLPAYQSEGAAAFDLRSRESVEIAPRTHAKVPLGVAMRLPEGHFAVLAVRSSLHKRGLMAANGVGIVDQDYCGDEDEYTAILYNFTDEPARIDKGERIMQVVPLAFAQHSFEEVTSLSAASRGGFGTTGNQ